MSIVDKNLIRMHLCAGTRDEALRNMGMLLFEKGYVRESYTEALLKREEIYPTGLNLQTISIAMPHTDPSHVLKPAIAIATMEKPVTFMHMGNTGVSVPAEISFVMAIQNPKEQIDQLRKVMKAFADPMIVRKFQLASDEQEIFTLGKRYFD